MNIRTRMNVTAVVVTALTALVLIGCCHTKPMTGGPPPEQGGDLIVKTNWAPTSAHCGAVIAVGDIESNTSGLFGVNPSTAYMYISPTLNMANFTEVGTHSEGAVGTHGASSWSGNVTVPATLASGNYYFITVCNETHTAPESSYNDNTNYCPIAITCP